MLDTATRKTFGEHCTISPMEYALILVYLNHKIVYHQQTVYKFPKDYTKQILDA